MNSERERADALHRAIEADLPGGSALSDAARAGVHHDLARLVAAARWLRASAAAPGSPRPTFVLALEDQLQTDLSLMGGTPQAAAGRPRARVASAVGLAALALAVVGLFLASGSRPGQAAYPLKQLVEVGMLRLLSPDAARSARWLDAGRARLTELEEAVAWQPDRAPALLEEVLSAYGQGLAAARAEGGTTSARAEQQAAVAADHLRRLAAGVEQRRPDLARWLVGGAATLDSTLALGPAPAVDAPPRDPPRAPATATPAEASPPAVLPAEPSQPSPAADATGLPTAAAGSVGPGSPSPAPSVGAAATEPPAWATERAEPVTRPPSTKVPPTLTPNAPWVPVTPTAAAGATNTPDRWPRTSTPPAATPAPTRPEGAGAPIDPTTTREDGGGAPQGCAAGR